MKKRISQSQIAKELGVSQSLVSLVLNGRRENISDEAYNRIWTMANERGYIPRGMRPQQAPDAMRCYVGIVLRPGLQLANHSNTFSHVQQGLFSVLQQSQISTTFLGNEGDLDEKMLYEILKRRDPLQGIVIYGQVKDSFLRALGELGTELLSVYAKTPGLCHSVTPNAPQALEQLVKHLTDLGHTRFAFLGGNKNMENSENRLTALRNSLAERGIELDDRFVVSVENGDRQEGYDCAEELARRTEGHKPPTAWICYNALMARGAVQYAFMHGIKIPGEVSVAAIDRTRVCTEIHPYLTSAASDPQTIGEEAAHLLSRMNDETRTGSRIFNDLMVPSSFMEGETSALCAG